MKRRTFVTSGLATGIGLVTPARLKAKDAVFRKTPRDAEGPFYPVGSRENDSNDLLARTESFHGDVLNLNIRLVDFYGDPVPDGIIDIWHTDPLGRYNHPQDGTPGERFDDFDYWGKAVANTDGNLSFRTYVPGAYRPRVAHIHYKVWRDNRPVLTSQIYFRELGGRRDRQVTDLQKIGDNEFKAEFLVVI